MKCDAWPVNKKPKEDWETLRAGGFKGYVAAGCPRLPYPAHFEKEVITDPTALIITADLKEGGFTLANLRWLNNRISSSRTRIDTAEYAKSLRLIDPEVGTSHNQRKAAHAKAAGTTTHGE